MRIQQARAEAAVDAHGEADDAVGQFRVGGWIQDHDPEGSRKAAKK
jgi:hypothetical protein